jgi:hypothetical protein
MEHLRYGMSNSGDVPARERNDSPTRLVKILLIASLSVIILAFDLWVVGLMEKSKADDFFQFWAAGRVLLQGDDPYDSQTWRQLYEQEDKWRWQTDQPVFPYPLWTAYPFVPLATLPVFWATLLWTVISQLFLVLSVGLMIKGLGWDNYKEWLPLIMTVLMIFEPFLLTILFGQLGMLLLVLMCGIFYLVSQGHYAVAGILLGLTLIKLQLFIVVIPTLLLVMMFKRRWAFIVSFTITALGLVISSWLLIPNWLVKWQANLAKTANVRLTISPTIWGFSHTVATALRRVDLWSAMSLLACLVLIGLISYLWHLRRNSLGKGDQLAPLLGLTMIISLLTTPYMLSYDFALLLFPVMICLWLIQSLPNLIQRPLLASLIGCAILSPWALLAISAQTGIETTSAFLPASLMAILLVADSAKHRWAVRIRDDLENGANPTQLR